MRFRYVLNSKTRVEGFLDQDVPIIQNVVHSHFFRGIILPAA